MLENIVKYKKWIIWLIALGVAAVAFVQKFLVDNPMPNGEPADSTVSAILQGLGLA